MRIFKTSLLISAVLLAAVQLPLGGQGLVNDGAKLVISNGATMVVSDEGSGQIKNNSGTLRNYGDLYIPGDLDNDGTFVNAASAAGAGRILLDGSTSGSGASVSEVWYSGQANDGSKPTGRWWYITPGASGTNSDSIAAHSLYRLYEYDEAAGAWSMMTGGGLALNQMQGYATRIGSDGAVGYAGEHFYQGTLSIGLSKAGSGWNLVGNPYPCPIDIEQAGGTATTFPAIWVRSNRQYATYNTLSGIGTNGGSQYIAPMQSFWLLCETAGTFRLDNSAKSMGSSQVLMKSAEADDRPELRLVLESEGQGDEAVLAYIAGAEEGYGPYDTEKRFGNCAGELYYPLEEGRNLAVNVLPEAKADTLPLGLKIAQTGAFSLKVAKLAHMPADLPVYLDDRATGASRLLEEGLRYDFDIADGDYSTRFRLRIGDGTTGTDRAHMEEGDPFLYALQGVLHIETRQWERAPVELRIFNLHGAAVANGRFEGEASYLMEVSALEGMHVVQLISGSRRYSRLLLF